MFNIDFKTKKCIRPCFNLKGVCNMTIYFESYLNFQENKTLNDMVDIIHIIQQSCNYLLEEGK